MKLKNMYILARKVDDFVVFIGYSGCAYSPYDTYSLDGKISLFEENPVIFNTVESADSFRSDVTKLLIEEQKKLAAEAGCSDICFDKAYYLNFEIMTLKQLAKLLGTTFKEMKQASIDLGLHKEWTCLGEVK